MTGLQSTATAQLAEFGLSVPTATDILDRARHSGVYFGRSGEQTFVVHYTADAGYTVTDTTPASEPTACERCGGPLAAGQGDGLTCGPCTDVASALADQDQAEQDQAEQTAQAVRDGMPAGDAELAEWVVTRAGQAGPIAIVDLAERHVGTFLRRMGARYAVRGTVTEYADDDQAEAMATEAERAAVLAYWLN